MGENDFPISDGEIYELFREEMVNRIKMTRSMPYERVSIKSFDGLTLRCRYYEYAPGAPVELQFHGYKGCAERDMSGGVERAFALGRSVVLIDQRASGESDGSVISSVSMSEKVYAACPHKNKRLVKIEGAGHGLAFPVDKELYINSMRETIIEWNL